MKLVPLVDKILVNEQQPSNNNVTLTDIKNSDKSNVVQNKADDTFNETYEDNNDLMDILNSESDVKEKIEQIKKIFTNNEKAANKNKSNFKKRKLNSTKKVLTRNEPFVPPNSAELMRKIK